MGFAENLKELRKTAHLTQTQLAQKIEYTQSNICEWEKGRVDPSIAAIIKLCIFFDVSADYLLGLEDETGQKTYINSFNNFNISGNSGTIKF